MLRAHEAAPHSSDEVVADKASVEVCDETLTARAAAGKSLIRTPRR